MYTENKDPAELLKLSEEVKRLSELYDKILNKINCMHDQIQLINQHFSIVDTWTTDDELEDRTRPRLR